MTKEIKLFNSMQLAKAEKKRRAGIWRPLETIPVNDKIKVTFVNGNDDPDNSQKSKDKRIKFQQRKSLINKLNTSSLTLEELNEYLRG